MIFRGREFHDEKQVFVGNYGRGYVCFAGCLRERGGICRFENRRNGFGSFVLPQGDGHYQFSVIDYNKGEFVDDRPIMTNFHLTGFDGSVESLTAHPMGYERYQILSKAYDQGTTVNGMKNLMKKVYYTKFYDFYSDNFWYSELSEGILTLADVGEPDLNGDVSRAGAYADKVAEEMANFEASSRTSEKKVWHTVHTSVYDCENKTLSVLPQKAGVSYDFTIE